jgi:hypothetical protein
MMGWSYKEMVSEQNCCVEKFDLQVMSHLEAAGIFLLLLYEYITIGLLD